MPHFELVASHIAMHLYNSVATVNLSLVLVHLFERLKSIMVKLITKQDAKYRSLNCNNPNVVKRIIRHKGVVEFLVLLGFEFEGDDVTRSLTCSQKPAICVIRDAMRALTASQLKFGFGNVTICADKYDEFNTLLLERDTHMTVSGYVRVNMNVYRMVIPDELIHLIALLYHENILRVTTIRKFSLSDSTLSIQQILECEDKTTNQNAIRTVLLMHKLYMDSVSFLKHIRNTFNNTSNRLNVLRIVQLWLQLYFDQDFKENDALRHTLEEWFSEELLNDTFTKKHGLNKDLRISNIISSIRKQLQCTAHEKCIESMDLLSVIHKKQQINDGLLVLGYIRTRSHRVLPIELHATFVMYFHNTNLPKGATALRLHFEDIAEQLTCIDVKLFNNIQDRELLDQNWKRIHQSSNVLKMIAHFNHITNFVQMQILNEYKLRDRAKVLTKLIKVARRLMELRNYNSLCAFFSALNSAPVHRLKAAWSRVPESCMVMLNEIRNLFDRNGDYCNLRRTLFNTAVDEPQIPYLGLYLQDLVFVDDGGARNVYNENRINFHKMLQINETIQRLMACKRSYDSKITEQLMAQKVILLELRKVKDVTEDQLWNMSTQSRSRDDFNPDQKPPYSGALFIQRS
eukprot:327918_1